MTRHAIVILVVGLAVVVFVACNKRAAGQEPANWSSFRGVAQAPITCTLSRAPKDAEGHVIGPFVNLDTIPAQAPDRVLDEPLGPGFQYVMDCHFTVQDGVVYEHWLYLPMLGGRYRAARR